MAEQSKRINRIKDYDPVTAHQLKQTHFCPHRIQCGYRRREMKRGRCQ
ncbi:DUF2963 domain-containing protein [Halalkalibaculum sp. DA384]